MTAEKKSKKRSKWPHLRYTRAADVDPKQQAATELLHLGAGATDQVAVKPEVQPRRRCGAGRVVCGFLIGVLLVLFLLGAVLLWFTNSFDNMVRQGLVFQEGGPLFAGWQKPPMKPTVRIYIYNYTNTFDFENGGAEKLRVQELGPYAYSESLERINVRFYENGTMSYSEKRSHVFEPSLSEGREDDVVVVPNLPFIGAMARMSEASFTTQLAFNTVLMGLAPGAFDTLPVKDFLFGYYNSLYSLAKGFSAIAGGGPIPKLGLLATRSGVSNDTYTVWTGKGDLSRLDVVSRFNGRSALSAWEDADCNRIDGSEGTFFNLDAVAQRRPVHLFNAGICRRLALEFKEEVTVMDGIPALKYGPPEDYFHNALDNEDNACYRHSSFRTHLPSGVFNNSPCSYGSPTFLSFPHFYLGDDALRTVVDGISPPDPEKHQLYFTVHPVLGMNLGAVTRIQINIMIKRASFIPHFSAFVDGTILPVAWIETNAVNFPEETKRAVYHATFTLRAVERGMMYAFPILSILFALIFSCIVVPCGSKVPKEKPVLVVTVV